VNWFTLAFLKISAETLRAQPIPLFFVRLLVDPNWHRGDSLPTLDYAWLHLDTLDYAWLSISHFDWRRPARLDALGYAWLHKPLHNRSTVHISANLPSLDAAWTRLDIPAKAPVTQ
jgi:hypothetical protein